MLFKYRIRKGKDTILNATFYQTNFGSMNVFSPLKVFDIQKIEFYKI